MAKMKLKTLSGAKKRFKMTASGKIKRNGIQTGLQTSLRQRKLDRIKYKQEFFVVKPCNARIISARINI